jgi:cytochrome c-type biogenesis protein CcmF
MLAISGYFFLWVALIANLTHLVKNRKANFSALTTLHIVPSYVFCLSMFASFLCLLLAFVRNDFSINYVVLHSHSLLPLFYRVAAAWGGHEGSLLLWQTIYATWVLAFIWQARRTWPAPLFNRTLFILHAVAVAFILFILLTSHPFVQSLWPIPLEGQDLNPLLQDPGLVTHPPMLYMGYVGTAINFAGALAILWGGEYLPAFSRWLRPWALASWSYLTLGIVLGSWWAYRELGWGGYWFWDPVENASLMPWLLATALLHSLMVTTKQGLFRNWSLLLAILTFVLSLVGTFLVRSGIITSVHAFTDDPTRGIFLLLFLGLVLGSALTLYAIRAPKFVSSGSFGFWSREFFLLMNNLLMVVAASTVLLGTVYPLIMDLLGLDKLSVGPNYFNTIFSPLTFLLLLLMGIGPLCFWHVTSKAQIWSRLRWPLLISSIAILAWRIIMGNDYSPVFICAIMTVLWLTTSIIVFIVPRLRQWRELPIGMLCGHLGMAMIVWGIAMSSFTGIERDVRLRLNEQAVLPGYIFTLKSLHESHGPNYYFDQATVMVQAEQHTQFLFPEKRYYVASHIGLSEAAIDAGFFRDIYVVMGERLSPNEWTFRLYIKPFVRWIWFGGLLLMSGGIIEIIRHFRRKKARGQDV